MARRFKGPLSGRRTRRGFRRGGSRRRPKGGFGFNINLNEAKSWFFDRIDWEEILEPAEYQALNRVGWILMKEGRKNIRNRKKPSRPKYPPSNWSNMLKDKPGILYGFDPDEMSVFVGPVKIQGTRAYKTLNQPTVPAVLEFGGKVWNRFSQYTRKGNWLPERRVATVQPRPYMQLALDRKWEKCQEVFEDFIGKSPRAMHVARSRAASKGGK